MSKRNELVPERTTTRPLGRMNLGPAVWFHKSSPTFLATPPPGLCSEASKSHKRKKMRAYFAGFRQGVQYEKSAETISREYRRYHEQLRSAPDVQCRQSSHLPEITKQIDTLAAQIETTLVTSSAPRLHDQLSGGISRDWKTPDAVPEASKYNSKYDPEESFLCCWLVDYCKDRDTRRKQRLVFSTWKMQTLDRILQGKEMTMKVLHRVCRCILGAWYSEMQEHRAPDLPIAESHAACALLRKIVALHLDERLQEVLDNARYDVFTQLHEVRKLAKRCHDFSERSHALMGHQISVLELFEDEEDFVELLAITKYGPVAVANWLKSRRPKGCPSFWADVYTRES